MRPNYCLLAWPAISYVSSLVIPKQKYMAEFKSEQLVREGEITKLFGNTRLALVDNGGDKNNVNLSLWFSRMITSEEDYHAFYGVPITEKSRTRPDFQFDPIVAAEIETLQPLPPPLEMAYAQCKASSVSQKMALNCVMGVSRSTRSEEIVRGNVSLPAVMIGDAAHAIPELLSPDAINATILDAKALSRMIIERYDDDSAFATIPRDFYDRNLETWGRLPWIWANKWIKAHGLPYEHWKYWVKQSPPFSARDHRANPIAPNRGPDHWAQCKLGAQDMSPTILRFKKGEEERWNRTEDRKANSRLRTLAYQPKLGVQQTEIVVRYLDSTRREPVDIEERPGQE